MSGFDSHMNMDGRSWEDLVPFQSKLNIEKSGIDDDSKRWQDEAMDCWQTGFSNVQKKLETLKHGSKSKIYQLILAVCNSDPSFDFCFL